jgi:hypothetical protein
MKPAEIYLAFLRPYEAERAKSGTAQSRRLTAAEIV